MRLRRKSIGLTGPVLTGQEKYNTFITVEQSACCSLKKKVRVCVCVGGGVMENNQQGDNGEKISIYLLSFMQTFLLKCCSFAGFHSHLITLLSFC